MLYFTQSGCRACDGAYPLLRSWLREVQEVPVVIVATGHRDSVRARLEGVVATTAFDSTRRAVAAYGIAGFPSALLVDADGRALKGALGSAALTQIREAVAAESVTGARR